MPAKRILKFTLHPLIHTSSPKTLAQDGGEGQNGAECGLKYVMWTARGFVRTVTNHAPIYGSRSKIAGPFLNRSI